MEHFLKDVLYEEISYDMTSLRLPNIFQLVQAQQLTLKYKSRVFISMLQWDVSRELHSVQVGKGF